MRKLIGLGITLLLTGCGGTTAQRFVNIPAFAGGTAASAVTAGAWQVTLTKAQVAFGPAYFCPIVGGSEESCSLAVVEVLDVTAVDALDPSPQSLGNMDGVTGTVLSATYDYGITWFQTQQHPAASPNAIHGHSAHFEGTATKGAQTILFSADLDLPPQAIGTQAVNNQSVSSAVISAATSRFDVTMNPSRWWQAANFDRIATLDTSGGTIVVPPQDIALNGVIQAMEANAPPSFAWTESSPAAAAVGSRAQNDKEIER
ncbi:MAG TPA: hypothetical protein VMV18_14885 [bacterium]|nr:hypothetical protein [bacterium]